MAVRVKSREIDLMGRVLVFTVEDERDRTKVIHAMLRFEPVEVELEDGTVATVSVWAMWDRNVFAGTLERWG